MDNQHPTHLTVSIRFFGAFRNFSSYFENKDTVVLTCQNPSTIAQIRMAFAQLLQTQCPIFNETLLSQSVFADDMRILPETTLIDKTTMLTILPPISGG